MLKIIGYFRSLIVHFFFFIKYQISPVTMKKPLWKYPLTLGFFFFCFQLYFDCFIAQSRRKKTYLSPVNLVMTNGSYKKTLIPLIASVNFFWRGQSVIALFLLTMVMFSTHLILSHLSLTWVHSIGGIWWWWFRAFILPWKNKLESI